MTTKTEHYINDDGVKMVKDTFLDDDGNEFGSATYPYVSPEEQERLEKEEEERRIKAAQEAEIARQQEEMEQAMKESTMTQILLNQATLMAALKEKGVID